MDCLTVVSGRSGGDNFGSEKSWSHRLVVVTPLRWFGEFGEFWGSAGLLFVRKHGFESQCCGLLHPVSLLPLASPSSGDVKYVFKT